MRVFDPDAFDETSPELVVGDERVCVKFKNGEVGCCEAALDFLQ